MEVLDLSDADDQMGGTGGDTGAPPEQGKSPKADAAGGGARSGEGAGEGEDDDAVTEESKESFPASDPPARY